MQQLAKIARKWIVAAVGTAMMTLPVAAAVQSEAQSVVRLEIAASLCGFALFGALQMFRSMRELRHLQFLHASAHAPGLSQDELQRILREVHHVVQSVPERGAQEKLP